MKTQGSVILAADPYPPYQYMERGRIVGLDHDIIVKAFKEKGVNVSIELYPWNECLRRVDEGLADGLFQIIKTPERERQYLFSDLLRRAATFLYKVKGLDIRLNSNLGLEMQLQSHKLGLVKDYGYGPLIDGLSDAVKVEVEDQIELLNGLAHGDFSLAAVDQGVAVHTLHRLGLEDYVEKVKCFKVTRDLCVAFHWDRRAFVQTFNEGLKRIKTNGEYKAVFKKYKVQS